MKRHINIDKKIEAFSEILDGLTSTEDKKKLLWKEIYENALTDRENANMLFDDAWSNMAEGTTGHATLGPVCCSCRSNKMKFAEPKDRAGQSEITFYSESFCACFGEL